MSKTQLQRKTNETQVKLSLDVAGAGVAKVATGVGFFDHMLELFAFHACFDLEVAASGDLHVCAHHTVEDIGIVLGQAFAKSLPAEKNFVRYATAFAPMDESLARAVVDISGRPCLVFRVEGLNAKIGDFDTELVQEFFQAFTNNAGLALHLEVLYGKNSHHMVEALFKAVGQALRQAIRLDQQRQGVASTKGAL